MSARVTGFGHAVPAAMGQQAVWDGFFAEHYAGNRVARRVFESAGITTRHAVVDPSREDLSETTTGERMRRYQQEAMPLGKEAVTGALEAAGLDADEVGLFSVVSCTGYGTPGIDILLGRDLGMTADVQRLVVGHMGCYAAIPGLGAVADFVTARRRPAVMLCLELTSLHVQPAAPSARQGAPSRDDLQQMVAHALFADAAAAVVLQPSDDGTDLAGLEVVDVAARTDVTTSDLMTWDVTDLGFKMGLSPKVPDVLALHVADVVDGLLSRNGFTRDDVRGWAIHPGGPRIVDVVQERLGLPDSATTASREVLREYGNCSSATVLLVVDRLLQTGGLADGDPVVALAFGPGLTLYATLLRVRG